MATNKIHLKMSLYAMLIGLVCVGLRRLFSPEIPQMIGLVAGLLMTSIGLVLSAVEVRSKLDFFYAYANNWNGGYIVNSGFLIGVGTFFFATTPLDGILWIAVISSLLFAERSVLGKRIPRQ